MHEAADIEIKHLILEIKLSDCGMLTGCYLSHLLLFTLFLLISL